MTYLANVLSALSGKLGGLQDSKCYDHGLFLVNDTEICGSRGLAEVTFNQSVRKWQIKSCHLENRVLLDSLPEVFSTLEAVIVDARNSEAMHGDAINPANTRDLVAF